MPGSKRPSTSSLRRYLTSRPYVSIAEIRRRFGLDHEAMSRVARNGTSAFVGLPEREATKLQDLWERNEIGVELSVEVRAPVIVGVYPMRIARFVVEGAASGNGHASRPYVNGHAPEPQSHVVVGTATAAVAEVAEADSGARPGTNEA